MSGLRDDHLLDRIAAGLCVGGGAIDCNSAATVRVEATFLRSNGSLVTLAVRMCPFHAPKEADRGTPHG